MAESFCIATYNIRWVLDYWPRRWPMIVREVSDLKTFPDGRKGPPDILALQEVNIGGGRLGQDAILSKLLPGHKLFSVAGIRAWVQVMWPLGFLNFLARGVVNFPGSTYLFDVAAWFCGKYFDRWFGPYAMQIYYTPGLGELLGVLTGAMWVLGNSTAISKRFNPSDKKVLCLGKEKVAVRVVIQIATKSISITNVHTIPSRKNTKTRRQQALKIMNWLSDEKVDGQIVLGDFNATPQEPLYSEFTKAGYVLHTLIPYTYTYIYIYMYIYYIFIHIYLHIYIYNSIHTYFTACRQLPNPNPNINPTLTLTLALALALTLALIQFVP
ncbi:hypothetical protein AAMO2058_001581700 [Amorphochlora amoebiformis]